MTGNLGVGVLGLGFGGVVAGLYVSTLIIYLLYDATCMMLCYDTTNLEAACI